MEKFLIIQWINEQIDRRIDHVLLQIYSYQNSVYFACKGAFGTPQISGFIPGF